MRICLINNLYTPYTRGGAERVVETIAKELQREQHHVVVITTVPSWAANMRAFARGGWYTEVVDGITVYRIATLNLFPYWTIGEYNILARLFWHLFDMFAVETASTVRKIVRREKPDVVMTHNLKGLGFLIPRTIRRLGLRHIHTVHDVQLAVPSGLLFANQSLSFISLMLTSWYERITRWIIGSPDIVISPSQWLQDFYDERGFFPKSKKVVLQNPISTLLPEQRRGPTPSTSSGDKFFRLLYVGQLEKHKGILFLIEAFKGFMIHDSRFTIRLDIVGSGSLLSRIKNETLDDPRIRVHGPIPHEKLSEFYANADALIVPSLVHENAPTVIFEAFAHGLPVIASRVGGIPEFVRDGETGWLFTAENVEELDAIFTKVLRDQSSLVQMGERGRLLLQQNETNIYTERLLQLLK